MDKDKPGPCRVELLDTETGRRVWVEHDMIAFWWAEGNGSCDCNRGDYFCVGDIEPNICDGAHRFLVCDARGDLDGYTVAQFNDAYPADLVAKWIKPRPIDPTETDANPPPEPELGTKH